MRFWSIVSLVALVGMIAVGHGAMGQEPGHASVAPPAEAAPAAPLDPTMDPMRVPVPEPSPEALQYYRSGNVLWTISTLWGLAVPALILFTGLSARMRTWAQRIGRKWFFVVALYFVFYTLLTYVVDLPLAFYAGFVRQHAYGLSNQTLTKWFGDSLTALALGLVVGAALIWVPYLLLAKSPRRWWLYTGLLALPLMFLMMLVFPVWVAPLFNDFGPMQDKQLEAEILALADRVGIEGGRVFEVNKSIDTKTMNAYVAGLWDTKRIVLWDTLLEKLDRDEVLSVMAHEMGHYVLGHVIQGLLVSFVSVLAGLYLVYRLSGWLLARYKDRFGFDRLSDVASLPLILLLMQLASLGVVPVAYAFSRHLEREADRFALELTQDNRAMATAFVKLQTENLANPRPGVFYKLWRGSHPSLAERIEFANTYRPWEHGQALRYGEYFRQPPDRLVVPRPR